MKALLTVLAALTCLLAAPAPAQPRAYTQAELAALLAPGEPQAFLVHGPYVMDTVQGLRRRAQPHVLYLPYSHPHVVYKRGWRHRHHHPRETAMTWRPFIPVPESQRQPIVRSTPPAPHARTPRHHDRRR